LIVQHLLMALRQKAAEQLVTQQPIGDAKIATPLLGVVDNSGYLGPDPPAAISSSKPGGNMCTRSIRSSSTTEPLRKNLQVSQSAR
jgi:hypothetical protein